MEKLNPWRPIKTIPENGTFLVWLEEEDKMFSSHIGLARWHPNGKIINGRFAYDMPKPLLWKYLPKSPSLEELNYEQNN